VLGERKRRREKEVVSQFQLFLIVENKKKITKGMI